MPQEEQKKVVVWTDGCFDLMHYGHANALRQAKSLGTYLIVGVHSDADIAAHKGPPVMKQEDRYRAARACKWVDEVVEGAPYVTSLQVLRKYNVDYCVHGDDIITDASGNDCYAEVKEAGLFRTVPRTNGVSTTDLVSRMLLMRQGTPSRHTSNPSLYDSSESVNSMDEGPNKESPYTRLSKFVPTTRQIVQFSNDTTPRPADKIGYIDGAFDLFHAGHISILEKARQQCDYLIVGVHDDETVNEVKGPNYPLLNLHERVLSVLSCRYVNEVIIGAPFVADATLLKSQNVSAVFSGTEHDVSYTVDPYVVSKDLGIYKLLESSCKTTTNSIIDRILEHRKLFMERNRKKEEKERRALEA